MLKLLHAELNRQSVEVFSPLSTVDPNEPGQQDAEQRRFRAQPSSGARRSSRGPAASGGGSLGSTAVQERWVSPETCGIQQATFWSNLNKSFRPIPQQRWTALTGAALV